MIFIIILFKRSECAFLPEIDAYIDYFNNTSIFTAYDSSKLKGEYNSNQVDVIWEFKGFGGTRVKNQILIHEYASLSTGNFPRLKNFLKSKINPNPNLRIFLNKEVKSGFIFNDGIDYSYRDMGIDKRFLHVKNTKKEYDFVYIGTINKSRNIHKLLEGFTKQNNGKLCLIGNVEDDIYHNFKNNKDILFTGKVPYIEVPKIASKAVYGINYIPDKYPYNLQTSTKLLEYLALGLKVITTDYQWVRQFEEKHGCSFYKLDYENMDFSIASLNDYQFVTNFNAKDFLWEKIIEKSGIVEKILDIYSKGK